MKRLLSLFICISALSAEAQQASQPPQVKSDIDITTLLPVSQSPNAVEGSIYADPQANPAERALDLIRRMTFGEKLAMSGGFNRFMLSPVERLGIRAVSMADASQGIRLQTARIKEHSTSFPGMLPLASTWNKELAHEFGRSIGEESRALGVDILLGPGINMQRLSAGGRNYEYMGEDPYLTANTGTQYIKGLQSMGVIATPKHFIGNDQEFCRHLASSNIDERTLREIYLVPWEMAIKEGKTMGMMTGNNIVNNIPIMMHRPLVMNILREEYGFRGITMTDWQNTQYHPGRQHLVLPSGETLLMPDNNTFRKWVEEQTALSSERRNEIEVMLEKMIFPNLYAAFAMGIYDRPFYDPAMFDTYGRHKETARRTAEEAIVMLRNEGNILPVRASKKVLLMGTDEIHSGEGSGFVTGYDHVSYEDGLRKVYGDNFTCEEAPGDKAIEEADVVLFRLNKRSGEGRDIPFEEPADQLSELRRVSKLNRNVVVLVSACNPMPMEWLDDVKGVLWCYFLGQERGNALAGIVSGSVNPSGKLPFTIERTFADSPSPEFNHIGGKPFWLGNNQYKAYWLGQSDKPLKGFSQYVEPGEFVQENYDEGIFIGYRWYDRKNIPVVFPFGYGLSYTTFEYSGMKVDDRLATEGKVYVSVTVRNRGKVAGKEVVQLYVSDDESSVERPVKELKAYEKVAVEPGESRSVTMELDTRSFAFWDTEAHDWKVEPGTFTIRVGGSSASLPLGAKLRVK